MRPAIAVLAGFGCFFFLTELLLRCFFPVGDIRIISDPNLIYRAKPHAIYYGYELETRTHFPIVYDRFGMRGDADSKKESRPRIIFYGDSFVEAAGVEDSGIVTTLLEAKLREKGATGARVWNAGIQGYGPDQEWILMQSQLKETQPDLIVWAVFAGNDLGDILRNRMFYLDGDKSRWQTPKVSPAVESQLMASERWIYLSEVVKRTLRVASSLKFRLLTVLPKKRNDSGPKAEVEDLRSYRAHEPVTQAFNDTLDVHFLMDPSSEVSTEKKKIFGALMKEVASHLPTGVPVLLVVIPFAESFDKRCTHRAERQCYPTALTDAISSSIAKAGLAFLNLYPTFLREEDPLHLYIPQDGHWNRKGHAVAANAIADVIVNGGFLPRFQAKTQKK